MNKLFFILILLLLGLVIKAEPVGNIYWIQFVSKTGTPYVIQHPEKFLSDRAIERRFRKNISIDSTDLPVNPVYIDSLSSIGFVVKHASRWMNGAIAVYSGALPIDSLKLPSFISFVELRKDIPLKSAFNKFETTDSLANSFYGNSAAQITMLNGDLLHRFSKGDGVHIAIIDAGFLNVDKLETFDSLFAKNALLGTQDFVAPGNNVFLEHNHGTSVLSIMAGNTPGIMVGTAPNAKYWLLRSEDVSSETPVEEDYWIIAAEFADSVGCDVINSSLGYTTFDNPAFNHTYDEFTGDSLRISKAANLAVKKGIVVVCSAGNSGSDSWHYIVAPSEAKNVLSVAAVNYKGELASFSSRGFGDSVTVLKPDISAMGSYTAIVSANGEYTYGSGTSFSSPVIAGMAACLVGLYPDSSSYSIIEMIRRAGNRYPQHSSDFGYGIPDFSMYLPNEPLDTTKLVKSDLNPHLVAFPNPFSDFITVISSDVIDKFELVAIDGRCVYGTERKRTDSNRLCATDLSNIPRGIYFIRSKVGTTFRTLKIIKN